MFIVHIKDKEPEVGGLEKDRKVIFLGKTIDGKYLVITAPKKFPDEEKSGEAHDLKNSELKAYLGERDQFTELTVEAGCRISSRCFLQGDGFTFSYEGDKKNNRKYSFFGDMFREVYIRM